MKQNLEDALRRLEGCAKTMQQKDDVAVVRSAILDCEENHERRTTSLEFHCECGNIVAELGNTCSECVVNAQGGLG